MSVPSVERHRIIQPFIGCSYQHTVLALYHKKLNYYICEGGKFKKNEMGRACDAYGGGERGAQGSGGET